MRPPARCARTHVGEADSRRVSRGAGDRPVGLQSAKPLGMSNDNVKQKIDEAADKAKDLAEKAGQKIKDGANTVSEKAHEAADKIKEAGRHVGNKVGS